VNSLSAAIQIPAKYKIAALQKGKNMKRKNIKNETKVIEVNCI
jgi:hypothetical protein